LEVVCAHRLHPALHLGEDNLALVNHCTRSVLAMWKSSSSLLPCFTMVER
jgi:hypothetical protein